MSKSIAYIAHGGGPLPVMRDPSQKYFIEGMEMISQQVPNPEAIVVITAHWEERGIGINASPSPQLYYDYGGFPPETYQYKYPAPGDPKLAEAIFNQLQANGIRSGLVTDRGWDHGVFVPLMVMYPKANIPVVSISLNHDMDPEVHIKLGQALAELPQDNILILGSGASFHNLPVYFRPPTEPGMHANKAFENWLVETCSSTGLSQNDRLERLLNWADVPFARFAQPREEHLLPLHVCVAAAGRPANKVFKIQLDHWINHNFMWDGA